MNSLHSTVLNLAIALFLTLGFSVGQANSEELPSITVSGTAKIQTEPDQATLDFAIESRNKKLADAVNDNEAKVKSVLGFLAELKIENKDIKPNMISVQPIYESINQQKWAKPLVQQMANAPAMNAARAPAPKDQMQPTGFVVRRQFSVLVRDLDAFEKIYLGLMARGVNNVTNANFKTSRLIELRNEARLEAVAIAEKKAREMATALGATLDRVHKITESNNGWRPMMSNVLSYESAEGNTSGFGIIEVTSNVTVVFVLGETKMENSGQ